MTSGRTGTRGWYRSRVRRCSALQAVVWWIFVRSLVRFVLWLVYRQRCFDRCESIGATEWYIVEQESYAHEPLQCVDLCLLSDTQTQWHNQTSMLAY